MSRPSKLAPRLLRPNPNFEEDLAWATEVTPRIEARVKSYPSVKKKKKKPCWISQDIGKAPIITLNDGRKMPSFGLGTFLGYNRKGRKILPEHDEVVQAVEWAIEAGYRHFDTAPIYGTEDQVGEGINNMIHEDVISRSDVFVTTKLWNTEHAPKNVIPALKESLRQLNLKYVDLYLIHWPVGLTDDGNFDNTDYLETWNAMIEAKDRGLTRSIGLSNFNQAMLDRVLSCTAVRPAVLQVEVNLNIQQSALLSYCKSQGVAVIAYSPFGSIFPKRAEWNAPPPRCDDPALVEIAARHGKTVPQVVLRHLVELGTVPIPKSTDYHSVFENIDVFDFSLSHEERELLAAFDSGYRTNPMLGWVDSPFYPFEKPEAEKKEEEQVVYIQKRRRSSCRSSIVSKYSYQDEEDSD